MSIQVLRLFGVLVLLAVTWLILSPDPLPSRDWQVLRNPFEHLLMFAGLAVVWLFIWPGRTRGMVLCLIAAAVLMEVVQVLIPVRAFQLDDMAMNLAGVGVGTGIYLALRWGQMKVRAKT